MKSIFLTAAISMFVTVAMAQTDTCITGLKNAATKYEQGDYDGAISILNNSLHNCPLSKQDQIQASKLLILCYLSIDHLEEADITAEAMMKIDPNYRPDKFKDDPRLSSLFARFKPEPTLAVGICGGFNFPRVNVIHTFSVVHDDDKPGLASYQSLPGFQVAGEIEKRVYKDLWAGIGIQFRTTSYSHQLDSVQGYTIDYHENLTYYDVPLSAKYFFLPGNIKPYLQAGVDFSYLSRALSTTRRNQENDIVDRTALRENFKVGYSGAAGISYSIKAFRVFGNFRYTFFPFLVNKSGTRYADEINLYKYYYVDDDFKMNNIQFNAGISYIVLYKIKKKKAGL